MYYLKKAIALFSMAEKYSTSFPAVGHLGWFSNLAVRKRASVNIDVLVFLSGILCF